MDKILFIDNNRILSDKLSACLADQSIIVEQATEMSDCINQIADNMYSLIVISISACEGWITFTVSIRNQTKVPVLILSDKENSVDEITAFRIGADDFVVRPRDITAFAQRLYALIRRYTVYAEQKKPSKEILHFTGLTIDAVQRIAYKNNTAVQLTKTEFDLLYLLAVHQGQTLTRDVIYSNLWNCDYIHDDRSINSHIQRLRKKIEDEPDNPVYILTVRNVGYRFNKELAS
jgi:DNA-binding response OmpR family regulator